jgi:hypothetical protein
VNGNLDELRTDLDRLLLRKVNQLGTAIEAILDGRATIPAVDASQVRRVWPIIVTAKITQSAPLHRLVERSLPSAFADARVQRLVIFDPEDLEVLAGMIEAGGSISEILAARQSSLYRDLEFTRWAYEDSRAPSPEVRPSYSEELFNRSTHAILDALQTREP